MTYEYSCLVCKHHFEVEQRITDKPLFECPNCKVCALQRLISGGGGFILNGGGWAKDGYSNGKETTTKKP